MKLKFKGQRAVTTDNIKDIKYEVQEDSIPKSKRRGLKLKQNTPIFGTET